MGISPLRLGTTQHAKPPPRSRRGTRPAVRIGGAYRTVPLLSDTVGPENLRRRFPRMNAAADVALVDGCFRALTELLPASGAPSAPTPADGTRNLLAIARAVRNYQTDRGGAIAAFQQIEDIRDDAERADRVILPDGLTWETLFTYGELARDLNTARDRPANPADYIHLGFFDDRIFQDEATRRFAASRVDGGRFNGGSVPAMLDLLGRCARDPRIIDIRWIAYLLATAMWETSHRVTVPNANGRGTHAVSRWATPVEEGGKGRLNAHDIKDYYLPVKVAATPDGGAVVTEQDGDTFTVSAAGAITRQSVGARHGSNANAAMTTTYRQALGAELCYFGRGYCQLTWWDSYASTGAEIGLGLQLLFNPERALEAEVAFEVMVHAMVYGLGFANGKRLQMYLSGGVTNYVGARAIVNGVNENVAIGRVAEVFEKCLLAARR